MSDLKVMTGTKTTHGKKITIALKTMSDKKVSRSMKSMRRPDVGNMETMIAVKTEELDRGEFSVQEGQCTEVPLCFWREG